MTFADRAGRRIRYEAIGEGPAVVLVPGLGGGARAFGTLPRRFVRAGFRCLTFDPVGVPPSSPLEGEFAFEAAAADVLAVLDATGTRKTAIVGTSLGGKVALALAATWPERIDRLVLLAAAATNSPRARRVYRFFEILATELPADRFGECVAPFLFGRTFHAHRPGLVDDMVRAHRGDSAPRTLMHAQAEALQQFDGSQLACRVTCPTLCMAGLEDTLTPVEEVRATAALIPGASFVAIEHAGHSLLLEDPKAFDTLCAFLRPDHA
jgi:pimeloyl-ACP methyl ester carboxylesterase